MPVELTNHYTRLRQRLAVHLKDHAPVEIGVLLPASLNEELSFYRLIMWGYALAQEAAKVPLAFLVALPPLNLVNQPLREISPLRTWIGHNLNLASDSDRKTLKKAQVWLRESCGTGTPSEPQHWEKCCKNLRSSILETLEGAMLACDVLDDDIDGPRLVDDLKKRVEQSWEAYRFDSYVADATNRLGFVGINVVTFRSKHLSAWRCIVQISDGAARDRLLTQRIEADLIELMSNALPITASELMSTLSLASSAHVATALMLLRGVQQNQLGNVDEILTRVCSGVLAVHQDDSSTSDK